MVDLKTLEVDLTQEIQYPKICIYGPPGVGKTTFATGAKPNVWLDPERSFDTLISQIRTGKLSAEDYKAYKINDLETTWEIAKKAVDSKKFKFITVDTVTRLQKVQLRSYIQGHKTVKEKVRTEFQTYQSDYLYSNNYMDAFLMWLIEAPIGVIMLAHQKDEYKASQMPTGEITRSLIKTSPDLTPKLSASATELFSVVGNLTAKVEQGTTKRKLRVNPTNIIVAKNRLNIQEQEISDPTYEGLMNYGTGPRK